MLKVQDDSVPPIEFTLQIDGEANKDMVWNHIDANYSAIKAGAEAPVVDADLEKKWKGKKK